MIEELYNRLVDWLMWEGYFYVIILTILVGIWEYFTKGKGKQKREDKKQQQETDDSLKRSKDGYLR